VLIYVLGICVVLRCAGFSARWVPLGFARVATWVFGVGLLLSALGNVASPSEWERYLLAPIALLLGVLCLVIARRSRERQDVTPVAAPGAELAA
jgi:hypothetical protein